MAYFAVLTYLFCFFLSSIVLGANLYLNGIMSAVYVLTAYIVMYLLLRTVTRKGKYWKSFSEEFVVSIASYLIFTLIGFAISYFAADMFLLSSENFKNFLNSISKVVSIVIAGFNAVIIDIATIEESKKWGD